MAIALGKHNSVSDAEGERGCCELRVSRPTVHDLPVPDSFVNLICGPRGHRIAIRITNGDKGIGTNSTVDRNTWILVLERDHCDFRDMPILGDAGAHSPFVCVANLSVFCGVVPGHRGSLSTRGRDLPRADEEVLDVVVA